MSTGDDELPVAPTTGEPLERPEETGNYPDPDDGAQDEVRQSTLPAYDEDLVDGADLETGP